MAVRPFPSLSTEKTKGSSIPTDDDDDAPSPPAARVPAIPLRDAQQELEEEEEEEEDKEVRGTGDDGEYRAEKDVLKGLKFTKKAGKIGRAHV